MLQIQARIKAVMAQSGYADEEEETGDSKAGPSAFFFVLFLSYLCVCVRKRIFLPRPD